jgi:hypothetical protein
MEVPVGSPLATPYPKMPLAAGAAAAAGSKARGTARAAVPAARPLRAERRSMRIGDMGWILHPGGAP